MSEHVVNGMRLVMREARPGDIALIKASYKQSQVWTLDPEPQDTDGLFDWLGRRCEKLIARTPPRVLCDAADHDVIVGWACVDTARNAAHFVYVKQSYHGIGLARLLLAGLTAPFAVTHWTPVCERINEKHPLNYKPSMLLGRRENGKAAQSRVAHGGGERVRGAR